MNHKDNLNDIEEIFEMMLKRSLEDYAEDNGQKLLEYSKLLDNKADPEYSESFKKNMSQIVSQRGVNLCKVGKIRFAIVCFILIVFISVCTTANKIKFINSIFHSDTEQLTISNSLSSITYPNIELPDNWEFIYLPEKIAIGYEYDKITFYETFVTIQYISTNNKKLIFTQFSDLDNTFSMDIENSDVREVLIDSNTGYIIENDSNCILIWNNDIRSFTLSGNCKENDLKDIASSLKIISK